jgi:hypothetical protein
LRTTGIEQEFTLHDLRRTRVPGCRSSG